MGSTVSEGMGAAPGHIRAFNALSGELEWIFHTIPKPGEYGYETWPEVLPYAVGHGIGLTLHDPPAISRITMQAGLPPIELKEGMVLALETYAGKKGGKDGVRLEENVLVTKNGCEVLTRWPIEELMECWIPYK